MSTNAMIQVEGSDLAVYKHWDGYPSATLPWLRAFHKKFLEERGVDEDYETAQLLRSSVLMQEEFDLDESTGTGWGIMHCPDITDACQFNYVLHKDGSVSVNGQHYQPDEEVVFDD